MGLKNEIQRDEGQEFRKNNGIIMRNIVTLFKYGWFSTKQLMQSLDAYNLSRNDIVDAILYFDDRDYIETKDAFTGEITRACDSDDITDLEIRLRADGALIGKSLLEDPGIDM